MPRALRKVQMVPLLLLLLSSPKVLSSAQLPSGTIDDPEVYRVYAAWARIVAGGPGTRRIALLEKTRDYHRCSPSLPNDWRAAWQNYQAENAHPRQLRSDATIGLPYQLISLKEFSALGGNLPDGQERNRALSEAYTHYPQGRIWAVSAVGFDSSRTQAVFATEFHCGFDCVGGSSMFMVKKGGEWVPARAKGLGVCMWIS